jgi:thiol-disulfide isomerase/thioredoxin
MSETHSLAILTTLFLLACSAEAQYVIQGVVVGYDGQSMIRADIMHLSNEERYPRRVLKIVRGDDNGAFRINFSRRGLYRLNFAGVHHKPLELPFYLSQPDTVVVRVQLGAIRYKPDFKEITFFAEYIVDSTKFRFRQRAAKTENGIFTATFKAQDDSLEYEIGGIDADDHIVNGTQADFYFPDRSGDYFSVLKTKKDSLTTITFDPGKLIRGNTEAKYEILRAPQETLKFFAIHNDFEKRMKKFREYAQSWQEKGISLADKNDYANRYDWSEDFKELEHMIKKEIDPFLRLGWYILRMQLALYDAWAKPELNLKKELAAAALREIPPDSPLWSYYPNSLKIALEQASKTEKHFGELRQEHVFLQEFGKPFMAYIAAVLDVHPDSSIRLYSLGEAVDLAHKFQAHELFEHYYNQVLTEFAGTPYAETLEKKYSPSRKIKPGAPIPDFAFPALDDPKKVITKKSLLGKNYIINFWALWCGPCKPVLQDLSAIYEQYRDKNFTILSISMDYKKDDVTDYRQRKLPMPWLHTYLQDWKPKQGVLNDFEVAAIPKVILIDKNGVIAAVGNPRGESFYNTVKELLEKK